jgi:hypothetical protein
VIRLSTFVTNTDDPKTCPQGAKRIKAALLGGMSIAVLASAPAMAESKWEPFPKTYTVNDFGGVGLLQTPTARFSPDGQAYVGFNRVFPYERYFVTLEATSWLEATLRYSSVSNRLYSPFPEFSGDQSYKDRGLDLKLKLLAEGKVRPAVAVGLRDFIGTGLFSSEYVVANKQFGRFDLSAGIGWGNLGTRGHIKNPFRLLSDKFEDRGVTTAGGGDLNSGYFKGRGAAFFGGVSYETPVEGLVAKVEYDPNSYQEEALGNRFRVSSPINVGLDYAVASWLHVGASFERGNKLGLKLVATTNFNTRSRMPKVDPPAPPLRPSAPTAPDTRTEANVAPGATKAVSEADRDASTPVTGTSPTSAGNVASVAGSSITKEAGSDVDRHQLAGALALQGSGLYSADFSANSVDLYVAQGRFRNMATGLGRISRAAFSVLPQRYQSVRVIFVENGVEAMAATVQRAELEKALLSPPGTSLDEFFDRTEFSDAPLALEDANYQVPSRPGFSWAVRPGLRTTLGRPEQFILYQLWARLHGTLALERGLYINGSVGVNIANNFDKLRIPSDSVLPRVRSDIKEYLREGRTALTHLIAEHNFNIAPSLYGHVYGGFLEEMFGGVGGEVLYRPYNANWAIGAEVTWAKQRDYDQWFDFRDYDVVTGHVTAFYHLAGPEVDVHIRAGRYLAKDWGATLTVARTFDSGISVGAFATKTNVSAREFGEGRFDKGIFVNIPLDLVFVRNVRSGIGILWRPLIRDGGQTIFIRRPLIATTGAATRYNMRRDWRDVLD